MKDREFNSVDDDPRLEMCLSNLPTYYVGQRIIDDGPEVAWLFATSIVHSQDRAASLHKVAHIVHQLTGLWSNDMVEVEPGDSPGDDNYLRVYCGRTKGGDSIWLHMVWDLGLTGEDHLALVSPIIWETGEPMGPSYHLDDPDDEITEVDIARWLYNVWTNVQTITEEKEDGKV